MRLRIIFITRNVLEICLCCHEIVVRIVIVYATGKEPPWPGNIRPTSEVEEDTSASLTLQISLSIIATTFSSFVISVTVYHYYKKNRIQKSIHIWKLDDSEFVDIRPVDDPSPAQNPSKQFTNVSRLAGKYKNFSVSIKQVSNFNVNIEMDYRLCMDLVHRINIKHHNINSMLGLRVTRSEVQMVQPWCSKGNLTSNIVPAQVGGNAA